MVKTRGSGKGREGLGMQVWGRGGGGSSAL